MSYRLVKSKAHYNIPKRISAFYKIYASKGDELQFKIKDYNRRKFDGIHEMKQIENQIVRF